MQQSLFGDPTRYVLIFPVRKGRVGLHYKFEGPTSALGFNGFGGKVEKDESLVDAVKRELDEELTGAGGLNHAYVDWAEEPVFLHQIGDSTYEVHIFAVTLKDWPTEGVLVPYTLWLSVEDFVRMTQVPDEVAFPFAAHAQTAALAALKELA